MARPPYLGHGVGLRRDHHDRVLSGPTANDWFEVISENVMGVGGRARATLDAVRERYPVVLHGVSLSIGTTDPLNLSYLDELRGLADSLEPAWVSDHLCWTGVGGRNAHDLLPLPYTEATLRHVVGRVKRVQDRLKRRIALENVSTYVSYRVSEMPEWEFVARVAEEADCGLLFDVNNVFVSAHNHRFDARTYVDAIPVERVWQFHLAGHSEMGDLFLDTHDHPVKDEVWDLYEHAVRRFGDVSTLIEWDDRIPSWDDLMGERAKAVERHRKAAGRLPEPAGERAAARAGA